MDLDEMKHAWRALDARLQRVEHGPSVRGAVRGATAVEITKLVVWALFLAFAAPALGTVWLPAGAIIVYALAGIVLGVMQIRAALRIDYLAPLVTLQRELLSLDRLRTRVSHALGLPWWLLWLAFPIVLGAHGGVVSPDVPLWVKANIVVCSVGLVAHLAIARYLSRRVSPRFLERLAATRLRRVANQLAELDAFER